MKAFKATTAIATVALLIATACSETKTEWVTAPSISPTNAVVTAPDGGGYYLPKLFNLQPCR